MNSKNQKDTEQETIDAPGPTPDGATFPGALTAPAGYELVKELGRGGMGVVYQARQLNPRRQVALKVMLSGHYATSQQQGRFRAEAEALAKLQHPNIVQIHEVGSHAGGTFIALELVAGGTLADKLRHTPLTPSAAANLAAVLAQAVHSAHQQGIIHRDLKPGNILITPDGAPKITDFGLAKDLDDDDARTQSGDILGTPSYMAPEQAQGRLSAIGPTTDVYALGGILYEMLLGHPPFKGATAHETLEQVLTQDPAPPRRSQPKIPRDLETICLKCLQKDPNRRYPSALALAEDVQRFLTNHPVLARPIGRWERCLKWARRRPAQATLYGAVAVLVLALVGAFFGFTMHLRGALDETTLKLRQEQAQREQESLKHQRGIQHNLYASDMRLAFQHWHAGEWQLARQALQRQIPQDGQEDFRGFEWHYLNGQCDYEPRILKLPGRGASLAFSPDGRTLASAGAFDRILLWNLDSGQLESPLPLSSSAESRVAWSPDGKILASVDQQAIVQLWDFPARLMRQALPAHRGPVITLGFSPDGAWLASGDQPYIARTTKICDVSTGKELMQFPSSPFAFAPDGKTLAAAVPGAPTARGLDAAWKVWDLATHRQRLHVDHPEPISCLAYAPDGRLLFTGDRTGGVIVWDPEQGKRLARLGRHDGPILSLAVSPDGKQLASAGEDGAVRLWDLGQAPRLRVILRGHGGQVFHVAFSPDSQLLASTGADQTIRLWEMRHFSTQESLPTPMPAAGPLAFSPDGKSLVLAGKDQTLCRVDAATLQVSQRWPAGGVPIQALALSEDDTWWATAGDEEIIQIWNPKNGRSLATLRGHTKEVSSLAVVPQSKELVSGGRDGGVKLWDPYSFREIKALRAPGGEIAIVAVSRDGRIVAAGGHVTVASHREGIVQCWHRETGKELAHLRPKDPVLSVVLTNDGGQVVASTNAGEVALWDLALKKIVSGFQGYSFNIRSLRLSPGDRWLGGVEGNTLFVWDFSSRRLVKNLSGVQYFAFSANGNMLATSGLDGRTFLWDLTTWNMRPLIQQPPGPVHSLAFSGDGRQLITGSLAQTSVMKNYRNLPFTRPTDHDVRTIVGSADGAARIWDLANEKPTQILPTPTWTQLHCLAQASKDTGLAAAGEGGCLFRWTGEARTVGPPVFVHAKARDDWRHWEEMLKFLPVSPTFHDSIHAVALAPRGKHLATACETRRRPPAVGDNPAWTVQIWDNVTGQELHAVNAGMGKWIALAFSPDGNTLAFNDGPRIKLYDVAKKQVVGSYQGSQGLVRALTFSPDGKTLAAGGADRLIILFDLAGLKQTELPGHADWVTSLAFSPDGKTLASASLDGAVKLWNPVLGQFLGTLGTTGKVLAVAFSTDGALLASGGENSQGIGEVLVWKSATLPGPAIRR